MLSDVIAAVSTPPGRSAVALIRVSGPGAHDVAAKVLPSFDPHPPRTAKRSRAVHPTRQEHLDDVLYVSFVQPASYTGEDLVEIWSHGGLLVPAEIMGALLAAGARPAGPGEFTRRAVLNGKVDLLQAEAIGDLVSATAPAQRRAALHQLDRGLSRRIDELRDRVLGLEALCSYEIDFPEEDDGPVAPERVESATALLEAELRALLGTAAEGRRLQEGALCVIAGRPNVGKSSLFNGLLGSERAIVTDIPGTTRDAIEAAATCDGFPFRLIDTAGLRESQDTVEQLGVQVSRRYLASADVVILCVEVGERITDDERAFLDGLDAPSLVVRTKADLMPSAAGGSEVPGDVVVSALTGAGLVELRSRLARLAFSSLEAQADLGWMITRERHRVCLQTALEEIVAFGSARQSGIDAVVAASHLRAAITALEDVIGVVSSEDVLDRVFSTFCVGK